MMITEEDKNQYKQIAEKVFLSKIKELTLIGQIGKWIKCFLAEIEELKKRIEKLEAEIVLLKRSRSNPESNGTSLSSESELQDEKKEILLTPELIAEIRLSFGCNMVEMAKLLGISTKQYNKIERGNILPSIELESKILQFRYMKATERREILQKNGIFVKSIKKIHALRIPYPPETPEIRITIAKMNEICETLHVSKAKLADLLGVSRYLVANWFYGKIQPNEENCKKLYQLLETQQKNISEESVTIKPAGAVSSDEISALLKELKWSVPVISAYLHVPDYKVYHWINGHSLPNKSQVNQIRILLDKVKMKKYDEIPVTTEEFSSIKEKLQYSDFHLSILLKIPFSRIHSWALGVDAPTVIESKKIRQLRDQITAGKFLDTTVLPRISADKIIEARKRQHLSMKEFLSKMGIRASTYRRWIYTKKGPSPAENEKLWRLWETPEPVIPKIITADELKVCRKTHNLSRRELANMLGIDKAYLGRWERGTSKIPLEISTKIQKHFNIPLDGEKDEK